MKVLRYGEGAAYIDVDADASTERAARTAAVVRVLRAAFPEADVIAGAGAVAVIGAEAPVVREALERSVTEASTSTESPRLHDIDVVYDGPDLDDVAAALGVSRAEVVELHAGRTYTVEVVGFLPGFAYMGPVDPRLVMPRRAAPRPRVPPQSVAVAGAFTGIYPLASPGGWNLLGRSLGPPPFDPSRAEPFLFAAGDRVRFHPASASRSAPDANGLDPNHSGTASAARALGSAANGLDPNQSGTAPAARAPGSAANGLDPNQSSSSGIASSGRASNDGGPALVVVRAAGVATIQDAGRRGLLHRGMPPSGPLDPALHAAANRALGNPPGAAAIELLAGSLVLRARGSVSVSIDGEAPVLLRDAEELRVAEGRRAARYVAIAGGVEVPVIVGARATLLSARIGGMEGRPLRRADVPPAGAADAASLAFDPAASVLPAGAPDTASLAFDAADDVDAAVDLDPGPHLERFPEGALDVLLSSAWRVSRLTDRTGARLEGAVIPRRGPDLAAPVPMRRGAVQVTTDGTPIVLGPDHPTTGGYPVLAVVRAASLGVLARKRPGDLVRFRLAGE